MQYGSETQILEILHFIYQSSLWKTNVGKLLEKWNAIIPTPKPEI